MRRIASVLTLAMLACSEKAPSYDTVIRNGTVYDGTGSAPVVADIAIAGDSIIAMGAPVSYWLPVFIPIILGVLSYIYYHKKSRIVSINLQHS